MGFIKSIRVLKWNSTSSSVYQTTINTTSPSFTLGLGLQYIILDATMTLVPASRFHAFEEVVDLKTLLASVDDYNKKYEFWRMNYLYTHSTCILWAVDRVGASHADAPYPDECYPDVLNKASKLLHGAAKLVHKTEVTQAAQWTVYAGMIAAFKLPGTQHYYGTFGKIIPRDQTVHYTVVQAEW